MGTFHAMYPPFLREAVDHARRLAALLDEMETRPGRRPPKPWLVGRAEEVECVVAELTGDWRRGGLNVAGAARSINAYVQGLHRGLAIHFGELAPACCVRSLVVTATPASFLTVTRAVPSSKTTGDVATTWDVQDAEIVEVTEGPGSE